MIEQVSVNMVQNFLQVRYENSYIPIVGAAPAPRFLILFKSILLKEKEYLVGPLWPRPGLQTYRATGKAPRVGLTARSLEGSHRTLASDETDLPREWVDFPEQSPAT